MRRAIDVVGATLGLIVTAPVIALAMVAIRAESRGHPIYKQRRVGMDGRPFDLLKLRTMVDGAENIGAGLAINENDSRITRVGALLRRTSLDELPNLLNVARGEMSFIGPRPTIPVQVDQYTERQRGRLAIRPGITGWAQVNGRASLPWSERIELDLYYIEHRGPLLDARIMWRTLAIVFGGSGLYKGETGGLGVKAPAVMLTGVGKRYDIVSCFAALTRVVAVDPNPLAPAQYAAHIRTSAPPIDDPQYVPALAELCERHGVGAVLPLTDLDIEKLARAREDGLLPALVPSAQVARATYDKYEAHLLLERLGLPSPPTVLPGEADFEALRYPVMVKPRQGSGARSIHLAHDAEQARFFVEYVREPTMVQRAMEGPELSIDCLGDTDGRCLNAIPRTMLESRGGESIKGTVIDDPELVELGRTAMEALQVRGPATIQVFRDPQLGVRITDVNTRFGGAFPAPALAALEGRTYPELIVRMAAGERPDTHVGEYRRDVTFTRYYWQLELDEGLRPNGKDITVGGPPPPRTPSTPPQPRGTPRVEDVEMQQ